MKVKVRNEQDGQSLFGFWLGSGAESCSWARVDRDGQEVAWEAGLEDWLRFFSPLSGSWNGGEQ